MSQAIHISPIDNVVVALHPIAKGQLVETDGLSVTALEDIPQGHKMAVKPIKAGEDVIKYGFPIGHATEDAQPGRWMHTHNIKTNLSGEVEYTYNPVPGLAPLPKVEPETFMGYRRKDGRAAIRNEIWIIPVVGCVNENAKKMVQDNQDLVTGSIDGLYTFPHPFGCSQTGHDHAQTRKLLAALVRHPNAAGVLVLHLGCENIQPDQFKAELGEYDPDRVKFLVCQEVEDEFAAARKLLEELADYARQFKREPIPVSELVVGMKCGGSDGLSGITANPTIGRFSDMLGQRGGSTVLTEVPEMFGAEGFLMNRCISREVFDKAEHMLNGFKNYFISHNEVVYDNPSPGNKQGGITTLEDKSCGCVQKGGTAPIMDVDPLLDRARHPLLGAGAHPQALHQHPAGREETRLDRLQRGRHRRRQKDHRRDRAGPAAAGDRHRQRQADQGRDQRLPRYLHLQGRRRALKKSGHAPKGMALFCKICYNRENGAAATAHTYKEALL